MQDFKLMNTWYLPSANTWKDFQLMAMKDVGMLTANSTGITFKGSNYFVNIVNITSVTLGKQGRDFINKWVRIEYIDSENSRNEAYFADGNNNGWSGIFGGTKKLHGFICDNYPIEKLQ